jgi:hypothetical protein
MTAYQRGSMNNRPALGNSRSAKTKTEAPLFIHDLQFLLATPYLLPAAKPRSRAIVRYFWRRTPLRFMARCGFARQNVGEWPQPS